MYIAIHGLFYGYWRFIFKLNWDFPFGFLPTTSVDLFRFRDVLPLAGVCKSILQSALRSSPGTGALRAPFDLFQRLLHPMRRHPARRFVTVLLGAKRVVEVRPYLL